MDLWNMLLKRGFEIPSLNYCLLGRWVCHMPSGVFRHSSIATSPPKPHECTVGWMAHYTIGVVLALVFVMVFAPAGWLARDRKSTRLNSSHLVISYAVFCLQKKLYA